MRIKRGESIWIDYENEEGLIPDTMTGRWKVVKANGDTLDEQPMNRNDSIFELRVPKSVTIKLAKEQYTLEAWVEDSDGYSDCIESQPLEIEKY